jgi:hypothetical protein
MCRITKNTFGKYFPLVFILLFKKERNKEGKERNHDRKNWRKIEGKRNKMNIKKERSRVKARDVSLLVRALD